MDKDSRLDESIKMISSMAISDIDVNRHINLIECQEKARKIEQFYRKLEDVVEMVDSAKSSFTTLITNQFVAGCNH
jgi:acetolactate synthase small subunit